MIEGRTVPGASQYTVYPDGTIRRRGFPLPLAARSTYPGHSMSLAVQMDAGYTTTLIVARLVGQAFCPDFRPHLRVGYRDGDRQNCRADNLKWLSQSEVTVGSPGAKRRTAKLTEQQVRAIRADSRTQKQIAEDYGLSEGYVSQLVRGKNWKHIL